MVHLLERSVMGEGLSQFHILFLVAGQNTQAQNTQTKNTQSPKIPKPKISKAEIPNIPKCPILK